MRELSEIRGMYDRIRSRNANRDQAMRNVYLVRSGKLNMVFPDLFPEGPFSEGIVANMVDVAARDLSEVIAPLPAFNCASSSMVSDRAKRFAEKRSRIVNDIVFHSKLQKQMYTAADRYVTYGFVPAMVEIDEEAKKPRIHFFDSVGSYPVYDRWGELTAIFMAGTWSRDELIARYPDARSFLNNPGYGNELVEVIRYHDKDTDFLFVPGAQSQTYVLESATNPVGKCLARMVRRPGLDDDMSRGQFDDVLALQVAKHRFTLLSLDAATKAVQAPLVVPPDITEMAIGPDATIRTMNPEKVRRVDLNVPTNTFAMTSELDMDIKLGSRYPESRTGNVGGSIVTGRGVQELQGGFDTQIRTAQAMFAGALTELMMLALEVQETVYPNVTHEVRGNDNGTPFAITYTASKDIAGDYTVDVQYGLMAGLDPNRALVFGLQARGDELISRDFMRRNMPFALNATEEEQKIDMEKLREAGFQALAGYAQSIPILAQNGMDPSPVIQKLVYVIDGRAKGKPFEELLSEAFAPPPAPPGVESTGAETPATGSPDQAPPGGSPGPEVPFGMNAMGGLQGVAQGQAGEAAGGRPTVESLLAGITGSGQPNLAASVNRRRGVNG